MTGKESMSRRWRTSAAALLVAGALAAAAAPARSADLPEIKKRGVLRVLYIPNERAPEFFSTKPGTPPGFDREILEGFAAAHRISVEAVPIKAWDQLIPELHAGRGDLIAGRFTATAERRKIIDFTVEVFPTRDVVLTRKPTKMVQNLDEFRRMKVGTVKGSNLAAAVAAAGVPPANVDDSYPPGGLPDALRGTRVTAVVVGVERAITAQREDPQLQIGLFVGKPESLAYGVKRGDAQLLSALNEHLEAMVQSGVWTRLVHKYFGTAAAEILKRARSAPVQ
jgi:ABC-type amino acid transport substrate-binding protein